MELLDLFRTKVLKLERQLEETPDRFIAKKRTLRRDLAVWNEAMELLKVYLASDINIRYGISGPIV